MSFSYDINQLDSISQVRSILADTNESSPFFQDEEILYFLEMHNQEVYAASSEGAYRLYVKYAHMARVAQVDDIRMVYGNNAERFEKIYESLKKLAQKKKLDKMKSAPFVFGGIDRDKFNSNREDLSLVKPDFTKNGIFHDRDFPEKTPLDSRRWWNGTHWETYND